MSSLCRGLVVVFVLLAGCRDMVEPDVDAVFSDVRRIEGRLVGLDPSATVSGNVTFRASVANDGTDLWFAPLEPDGSFVTFVRRGSAPTVAIEVDFDASSRHADWAFEPVRLDSTLLELPYDAVALGGRIVWPVAFDSTRVEGRMVTPTVVAGIPGSFLATDGGFPIDAEGRFESWIPRGLWDLELDLADGARFEWEDVEPSDALELELPLRPVEVQIAAPDGLLNEQSFRLHVAVPPVGERPFAEVVAESLRTDTSRIVWMPDPALDDAVAIVGRYRPGFNRVVLDGFEQQTLTLIDGDPARLRIDLGQLSLRVVALRDGEPYTSFGFRLEGIDDSGSAFLDGDGVAWFARRPGRYWLRFSAADDAIWEVDLTENTELVVELAPFLD